MNHEQDKAASVPAGWKLVPVEPTDDMLANVDEEVGGHCHSCTKWNASWSDCRRVYAAMLAAAPAAPQTEAQPTTNSYRKKPVVIEAIQWDGSWGSMEAIKAAFPAVEVCASTLHPPTKTVRGWSIRTLEGSHVVSVGDYIIKGVKGEFYPCKPDIFAMTYEPATPSAQAEPPICGNCDEPAPGCGGLFASDGAACQFHGKQAEQGGK